MKSLKNNEILQKIYNICVNLKKINKIYIKFDWKYIKSLKFMKTFIKYVKISQVYLLIDLDL